MPYYEIPRGDPGPLKTAGGFHQAENHVEARHTERTMSYPRRDLAREEFAMERRKGIIGSQNGDVPREDVQVPHLGSDPALEGSSPAADGWQPRDGADEDWGVVPRDWKK